MAVLRILANATSTGSDTEEEESVSEERASAGVVKTVNGLELALLDPRG